MSEEDECPVCMDPFGTGPHTKVFPFGCKDGVRHAVCRKCDRTLFMRRDDRCPTCREPRTTESTLAGGHRPMPLPSDYGHYGSFDHLPMSQLVMPPAGMPGHMPQGSPETPAQLSARTYDLLEAWMPRRIGRGSGLSLFGPPMASSGAGAYGGNIGDLWGMQRQHALGVLNNLLEPNDPLDPADEFDVDADSDLAETARFEFAEAARVRRELRAAPPRRREGEGAALASMTNDRSIREAIDGLIDVPGVTASAYARRMRPARQAR